MQLSGAVVQLYCTVQQYKCIFCSQSASFFLVMQCVLKSLFSCVACGNEGRRNVWLICCLLLCHPNTTAPMLLHYNSWTSSITMQLFCSAWKIVLQCVSFEYSYRACNFSSIYLDALKCFVCRCIALHLGALHCFAFERFHNIYSDCWDAVHWNILYDDVLNCITLHCITLHCIALHCIALHCIALHCIDRDHRRPLKSRRAPLLRTCIVLVFHYL